MKNPAIKYTVYYARQHGTWVDNWHESIDVNARDYGRALIAADKQFQRLFRPRIVNGWNAVAVQIIAENSPYILILCPCCKLWMRSFHIPR